MKNLAVIICIAILFSICVQASESQVILLAYEKTRFKTGLMEEMKKNLENEGFTVEILEHSKGGLDNIDTDRYAAIFITNSGVNSKVRPWVSKWISESGAKDKILLHTTQRSDWKVETDVDAVTSASERKNISAFAREYTERIKALISQNND